MGEQQSVHRLQVGELLREPAEKVQYSGEVYGLNGNGEGVSVLVIDSGAPFHCAIRSPDTYAEIHTANFTTSPNDRDFLGYATVVAGILQGEHPKLKGFLPEAELFYAKAIDDHAVGRFDAFIAAVLWGTIKRVDIILLPMSQTVDNYALHEAIIKAHADNVCVVAPMGMDGSSYPAIYPEVLSVGATASNGGSRLSAPGEIDIKGDNVISAYLEDTFVKASGTAVAAAQAAGLLALIIEGRKKAKIKFRPDDVYEAVRKLNAAKSS